MRWLAIILCVIAASRLGAQAASPAGSLIAGVTVDSIRGGPLRGAIVHVAGTALRSVSDSSGRFSISGVPAGDHRLEVTHPFLDTLRLALRTTARQVSGADSTFFVLSTPSAATLVSLKCERQERDDGGAMALGFVTLAGSGEAAEGAMVNVEWTEYEVVGRTLRRVPHRRAGLAGPDGSYKICGVPTDLETDVIAFRGRDTTAALLSSFHSGVAIVSFRLPPPPRATAAGGDSSVGTSSIVGRVVDSAGRPVEGARVSTERDLQVTTTGSDGSFRLAGLVAGTRSLMVRRIGFLPLAYPIDVDDDKEHDVGITLTTYVPVLETVLVRARRDFALDRVGFSSRRRSSTGRFVGPDDIERRRPLRLNDILSTIPSLRTGRTSSGEEYVAGSRRGECVRYFVDGHLWADIGDGPNTFLSGREIGAVEVYSGLSRPPEFIAQGRSGESCAAVVVWTRWKLRI